MQRAANKTRNLKKEKLFVSLVTLIMQLTQFDTASKNAKLNITPPNN